MNRLTVIQDLINKINAKSYLEIGVCFGDIIINVDVKNKYGVDPKFQIPNLEVNGKETFYDTKNNIMTLYELESDTFFKNFAKKDLHNGIDIAFVDGLHSYPQSLKDVENCLKYLNPNGFIIMHDCNPLNYAMSYPIVNSINEVIELGEKGELEGWNGAWNGDVWKALVHLRVKHDDLEIFTIDIDWGLGIIRKGKSNQLKDITIQDIEISDYYFLEKNREKLLNLKHPRYFKEFLLN
ncbi:MAG: class I SAM-dependent methyltransferase [Candidatus Sericytochromatia bacterium]